MRQGDGSEHAVTSVLAGSRIPIEALAGMGSLLSLRVRVSIPRFAKRCDRRLRFGLVWPSPSAHKNPPASEVLACGRMRDSGDDRLSRQKHYHGPGGLNGRVRNGNGCCPARMVAGNVPGRRSSAAGHVISEVGHTATHKPLEAMKWVCSTTGKSNEPYRNDTPDRSDAVCPRATGWWPRGGSAPIGVVKLLGC
jgi:hypothetical protein